MQVAQMGQIYTACTQVVVYLGPDVAPVLPAGRHPRRMRLAEFGKSGGTGLGPSGVQGVEELLKRRYFSRLWVVQELILSPRVVIRIGDIDFQSDGTTSGRLWELEAKALAPWVQHTSRGAPLGLDLVRMMQLTFSTSCADPRDRLFGLMGVVSNKSSNFEPDYSLPVQAVFIGLFAHLLLAKGLRNLLALGSGVSRNGSVPSWVPDWTSWDQWRAVFEYRPGSGAGVDERDPFTSTISALRAQRLWHFNHELASVLLPLRYRPAGCPCHGATLAGVDPMSGSILAENLAPVLLPLHPRRSVALPFLQGGDPRSGVIPPEKPAPFRASTVLPSEEAIIYGVDAMTGALKARLVRLLALTSVPKRLAALAKQKKNGPAVFEIGCGNHNVYLTSLRPLDLLVVPGNDYLYLFPHEESETNRRPGLCILRRSTSCAESAVQLVATCETVLFQVSPQERPQPLFPVARTPISWDTQLFQWPRGPLESLNTQIISELHWTLCEAIERTQTWLNSHLMPEEQVLFLPKHPSTPKDSLSVYWALLDEKPNVLVRAYKQYMVEHCGARDEPDHVEFDTLAPMDPRHAIHFVNRSGGFARPVRSPDKAHHMVWVRPTKKRAGTVSIPCEVARETLSKSIGKQLLFMVRMAAWRTGEPEEQLLSREITEADCLVRVPTGYYAERLMAEYGCDGTVEDVMII